MHFLTIPILLCCAGNGCHLPPLRDYKEYHTDTTVRFVVELSAEKMREAEALGIHKKFKLESTINTSNLVRGKERERGESSGWSSSSLRFSYSSLFSLLLLPPSPPLHLPFSLPPSHRFSLTTMAACAGMRVWLRFCRSSTKSVWTSTGSVRSSLREN